MTRKVRILARIVFILYIVTVAWLCFGQFGSMPDVRRSYWGIPTDKIVHFLMFFPFPPLAYLAIGRSPDRFRTAFLWTAAIFLTGCLFAALTEIIQAKLLPYRMGDFADLKADLIALGSSSILVLAIVLWKLRK